MITMSPAAIGRRVANPSPNGNWVVAVSCVEAAEGGEAEEADVEEAEEAAATGVLAMGEKVAGWVNQKIRSGGKIGFVSLPYIIFPSRPHYTSLSHPLAPPTLSIAPC
jgi:hypothetical protein